MSKKSMLLVLAIFSAILLIGINVDVMAHSASDLNLSYNSTTKELDVTINHVVSDRNSHFIISVEIKVNGITVTTEPYTSQPTTSTFLYQYTNITASNGDTITVIAICNSVGTISRSITVGESVAPGIPGYLGFWLIVVLSVITLLTIIRKRIVRTNN